MDIKKSKINSISAYLQTKDTPLGQIIQRAQHIHTLQNDLKLELGSEFSGHFWVGSYENGFLTLLVDSASLATKLRFSIPDIRENLRKQNAWFGLKSINVKILVTKSIS
jgi:hypothetical protein